MNFHSSRFTRSPVIHGGGTTQPADGVVFLGSSTGGTQDSDTAGAGTDTVSLPGSLAENDIVVVALSSDLSLDSSTIVSTGWTVLWQSADISPENWIVYKIMGATPDTGIEITRGTSEGVVVCMAFRGVDTVTPVDNGISSAADGTGPTYPNPPSHTTITAGAMRIVTGHLDDDSDTLAAPSGFETNFTSHAFAGSDATTAMGYAVAASAGALDPGEMTGSAGGDAWHSHHFALRPA